MDESFYREWFKGFSDSIDEMKAESRSLLLKHCAMRCADSGVMERYEQHFQKVHGERDAFYLQLDELGGVRGEVIIPNKEYLVIFPKCLCDLHISGGVNTPNLCECSRQSILYVNEKIWGKHQCVVECTGTILSGEDECRFKVIYC